MSVYRPPGYKKSEIRTFQKIMEHECNKIKNKKSIIVGDFNININASEKLKMEVAYELINTMMGSGFILCNNDTATRSHRDAVLDHVYTNYQGILLELCFTNMDISDHKVIVGNFRSDTDKQNVVKNAVHKAKIIDYNKIKRNILKYQILSSEIDIDFKTEQLVKKLNNIQEENTKIKIRCVKKDSWIDDNFKQIIVHKNIWYNKWCKDKSNTLLKNEYQYWVKEAKRYKNKCKVKYFNKKLEENKHDIKKTWTTLNKLVGRDSKKKGTIKMIENTCGEQRVKILNEMNSYFANMGLNLIKTFPNHINKFKTPSKNKFQFYMLSENEVIKIIKNLKNTNSSGPDGIKTKVLKTICEYAAKEVQSIINISLSEGHVPKLLKSSAVTPIYKSGELSDMSNYRPINVIPVLAKVLEAAAAEQIRNHLETENILTQHQYGFRPRSSTTAALHDLVSDLQQARDDGKEAIAIFVDIRKAFDAVDHQILLRKLLRYGFAGPSLSWMISYLSGRTQKVKYGDGTSEEADVAAGVPQGSRLGPILFTIFINDIEDAGMLGKLFIYADDICIVHTGYLLDEVYRHAQQDLDKLRSWAGDNKITVNEIKTQYMHLGKLNIDKKLKYDKNDITKISKFKYLGIIIDNKLKFDDHINSLTKKISALTGTIRRNRYKSLPQEIRRTLYYSLGESILSYGAQIWGSTNKKLIHKIKRAQNKLIKAIFHLNKFTRSHTLYKELKLHPIEVIIKIQQIVYIHKNKNKQIHTQNLVQIHEENRRNKGNVINIKPKTTKFGINSIHYHAINNYNNLPSKLKNINNNVQFKEFKKLLIDTL